VNFERKPRPSARGGCQSTTKDVALDHYKEFAQCLREEFESDERQLPTSDISTDTWSRDADVADETPSPEAVDVTTAEADEMSFAVEPVLDEECTVSAHRSVSGRREERDATRDDELECDGPAACWQLTREDIDAAMATITDDVVAPDGGRPSPTLLESWRTVSRRWRSRLPAGASGRGSDAGA